NLEDAKRLLTNLKNTEQRNVVKQTTNVNVQRKQEEIDQITEEINQKKLILAEHEKEALACEELIQKIELQLSQNKDIALIQEKLKIQMDTKATKEEYLMKLKNDIVKEVFIAMPFLLLNDIFHNITNYLEGTIADNESNVPLEIIEESISKEKCL